MADQAEIDRYLAYLNAPEREKEAEEAQRRFIQTVLDDIYHPDPECLPVTVV